jgi:hypothetical protein
LDRIGVSLFVRRPLRSGMSTTITTPRADESCAYCESRIFDHDPVCVRDCTDECGSPTYFCNYACLAAHIEETDLTTGDACEWSPES